MRRVPLYLLIALVTLAVTSTASGDDDDDASSATASNESGAEPRRARSIGFVWRGLLQRGVFLAESERVRHVERFAPHGRFFGTTEMVGLLRRAAESVWERHPGARLNVGEISQRGGGNVVGHRSHENGRDVDLGFYVVDSEGEPVEPEQFVRINSAGRGSTGEQVVHFDTARNWALLEHFVTERETPVMMVVVSPRIRRRLTRWARSHGVDDELVDRVDWFLVPPHRGSRHDDHFHVRIYCAPDDAGHCEDRGPYWHWVPDTFVPEEAERLPRYWPHPSATD